MIVAGTARVTRGDETFLLHEDQSCIIPAGVVHCLENPGILPLELIEIQVGAYLGDDDVVRYNDSAVKSRFCNCRGMNEKPDTSVAAVRLFGNDKTCRFLIP